MVTQQRYVQTNPTSDLLLNFPTPTLLNPNRTTNPNLTILQVSTYQIRDSNKLVEEYMLLANYLVAQELLLRNGSSAFLRNHPPPKAGGLEDLKALAEKLGELWSI